MISTQPERLSDVGKRRKLQRGTCSVCHRRGRLLKKGAMGMHYEHMRNFYKRGDVDNYLCNGSFREPTGEMSLGGIEELRPG